ncbi:MAG: hypothetical protein R2714_02855 [Microthrixaceae bacterium]
MAETCHHLLHGRPLLGGDGAGGVAQIVEVHVGEPEGSLGETPLPLEPAIADDPAGLAREQGSVRVATDEASEVLIDGIENEAGECHSPLTRFGLGLFVA